MIFWAWWSLKERWLGAMRTMGPVGDKYNSVVEEGGGGGGG